MHTGVSSYEVIWQVFFERYTRVLLEASPEFPIHFLKIYTFGLRWFNCDSSKIYSRKCSTTLLNVGFTITIVAIKVASDRGRHRLSS
jgi:hypothetical protein